MAAPVDEPPVIIHSTTEPPTEPPKLTSEDLTSVAGVNTRTPATLPPVTNDAAHVKDIGWDEEPAHVGPLVEGIGNEDIWLLIRRLNKTVFHLKDSPRVPDGGLDLAVAPEQEFSPNKMRAQMERLYMSVIIYVLAGLKHINRLRSWNEKIRTRVFCFVYFALWAFDYLTLGISLIVLALIMSTTVRTILFPPAPLPLVGSLSGTVTKPNSGVLGSKESITGAPENMKGEAVENEASNFVTALAGIAVNIMSGQDPQGEPNPSGEDLHGPMKANPNQLATMVASGKDKAEGVDRPSQDKSKAPMETIMWSKVRPAMHVMTAMCEYAEKMANALTPDPKPPFDQQTARLRLAGAVVPLVALSPFVTRDIVVRSATLIFGVLLFGQPLINAACTWLDDNYPGWTKKVNINNSLFYHVPTNPQLALALLRYGEKKKTPLPPPPRVASGPSEEALPLTDDILSATAGDQPLGASDLELREAAAPDRDVLDDAGGDDVEASKDENSKEPHKFLRVLKSATRKGVKGAVQVDKARAKLGNEGAKRRMGVIPGKGRYEPVTGPQEFDARYEGEKGFLLIDTTNSAGAMLSFNKESIKNTQTPTSLWVLPIDEIKELRKHSGYGFKSKLAAGWALDQELNDSLGISDGKGNEWAVTAIPHRDALFNRLIALGKQGWEVW